MWRQSFGDSGEVLGAVGHILGGLREYPSDLSCGHECCDKVLMATVCDPGALRFVRGALESEMTYTYEVLGFWILSTRLQVSRNSGDNGGWHVDCHSPLLQ